MELSKLLWILVGLVGAGCGAPQQSSPNPANPAPAAPGGPVGTAQPPPPLRIEFRNGQVPRAPATLPASPIVPAPPAPAASRDGDELDSAPDAEESEGPVIVGEDVKSEFFLTPYLSEVLETIYFLIDLWYHKTIVTGIDRIGHQLTTVQKKLTVLTNPTDPNAPESPPETDNPFRRTDLFQSTRMTAALIKRLVKLASA